MLTLGSYLEERAAKLCREALGCIQVALAGSSPNAMYSTIDSFFGYQSADEEQGKSEVVYPRDEPVDSESIRTFGGFPAGPSKLPPNLISVRGKTDTVVSHSSGSESDAVERSRQPHQPSCDQSNSLQTWIYQTSLDKNWYPQGILAY